MEAFGRSVRYFPLVGAVIGMLLVLVFELGAGRLPFHILSAALLISWIFITGGLHCDGFMDTMDGLFSGRTQERMLEIMKDSRVGSNGVTAFVLLTVGKWSALMDMDPSSLPAALFCAPVLGRLAMVMGVTLFPYARPEGMGKAFAEFAGRPAMLVAMAIAAVLLVPVGKAAAAAAAVAVVFAWMFCSYAAGKLGGLTGDVYGAVTELTELIVLFAFLF